MYLFLNSLSQFWGSLQSGRILSSPREESHGSYGDWNANWHRGNQGGWWVQYRWVFEQGNRAQQVQALKSLGPQRVTPEVVSTIRRWLRRGTGAKVLKDTRWSKYSNVLKPWVMS